MSESGQPVFKPPYMAFQTLWSFIAGLSEHPLPPQIDRSMMPSKSGTDQANLINTLRAFDLVDDNCRVLPDLTAIASADADSKPPLLADIVRRYYAAALAVSDDNGTAAQLEQCFRDRYAVAGADTLRKSITFFLHAARTGGLPLSPHFKPTRSGSGAPGQPRRRDAKRKSTNVGANAEPLARSSTERTNVYRLDVRLRTGGTMTLTVNVNPISLRGEDRTFFYDIVDKLTDYDPPDAADLEDGADEGSANSQ